MGKSGCRHVRDLLERLKARYGAAQALWVVSRLAGAFGIAGCWTGRLTWQPGWTADRLSVGRWRLCRCRSSAAIPFPPLWIGLEATFRTSEPFPHNPAAARAVTLFSANALSSAKKKTCRKDGHARPPVVIHARARGVPSLDRFDNILLSCVAKWQIFAEFWRRKKIFFCERLHVKTENFCRSG